MSPLEGALILALVVVAFLGWWSNQCRCDQCSFHRLERVQKAERERLEAIERQRTADERRHEYQHKGALAASYDPDKFDCPDRTCRRNKTGVDSGA